MSPLFPFMTSRNFYFQHELSLSLILLKESEHFFSRIIKLILPSAVVNFHSLRDLRTINALEYLFDDLNVEHFQLVHVSVFFFACDTPTMQPGMNPAAFVLNGLLVGPYGVQRGLLRQVRKGGLLDGVIETLALRQCHRDQVTHVLLIVIEALKLKLLLGVCVED